MSRFVKLFITYPAILFIPLIITVFLYSTRFFYDPINFDESYNLQVPVNFALYDEYASNGSQFDGNNKLFDPYISTGPSLLIPMGLSFKFFGIGVWQYRIITAAIFIALIVLVVLSIFPKGNSQTNKHLTYALAVIGVLFTVSIVNVSDNTSLLVAAMGESMATFFLLFSAYVLPKHVFIASLSVGLAILTKLLFFLIVPFFLVTVFLYHRNSTITHKLSLLIKSLVGILLPLLIFEYYRFAIFKFDTNAYLDNINEFIEFFKKGGSGTNEISFTILSILKSKAFVASHINPVFDKWSIRIATLMLGIYILFWLFSLIRKIKFTIRVNENNMIYFTGTAFFWLSWWVIMSDSVYSRHIIPVLILLIIIFIKLILHTYKYVINQSLHTIFIVVVCISSFGLSIAVTLHGVPTSNRLLKQQEDIIPVKEFYATKKLYHVGWWQNPEVQFLLNKHSYPVKTIEKAGFVLTGVNIPERNESFCTSTIALNNYYKACKIIRN